MITAEEARELSLHNKHIIKHIKKIETGIECAISEGRTFYNFPVAFITPAELTKIKDTIAKYGYNWYEGLTAGIPTLHIMW